nr:hypothetical protein HWPLAUVJ_HWPLAUVJ_CDS_0006 [Microvirus sp.]
MRIKNIFFPYPNYICFHINNPNSVMDYNRI